MDVEHLSTFGLSRDPFANEPQLGCYFDAAVFQDAERRLSRAAQQGKGLVLLTGAGGSGKTMLVRHWLESLEEELYEACMLVPVPGVSDGPWILQRLASHLGVESPAQEPAALLGQIYEQLAVVREDGRSTVVIVDEAQVLADRGVLAELRGLLNLEYEDRRLLTLILVGLPELASAAASDTALSDRTDVRVRLAPLDAQATAAYLAHRIRAVGGDPGILEGGALQALVKYGAGVPRRLNTLADNALFEAHLAGRKTLSPADVERAAAELGVEGADSPAPAPPPVSAPAAMAEPEPVMATPADPETLVLEEVVAAETDPHLRGAAEPSAEIVPDDEDDGELDGLFADILDD